MIPAYQERKKAMTDYKNMVQGINIAELDPREFPKVEAEYSYLKYVFNLREVEEEIRVMIDSVLDLREMQAIKEIISAYIESCASSENPGEEYMRYIIKMQYIPAIIALMVKTADVMTVDLIFQLLTKVAENGADADIVN